MDKINAWALRQLPSRRQTLIVKLCDDGLLIGDMPRLVAWQSINGIVAARNDEFIGHTILLVIGISDGTSLQISEHTEYWDDLIKAIPIHLAGAKRLVDWALQSAFSYNHVVIFHR